MQKRQISARPAEKQPYDFVRSVRANRGLDGRGRIPGTRLPERRCGGTRFLEKAGVPRTPSGKNFYIFTVNWERPDLSCAGTQISDYSSLFRKHLGEILPHQTRPCKERILRNPLFCNPAFCAGFRTFPQKLLNVFNQPMTRYSHSPLIHRKHDKSSFWRVRAH